MKDTTCCFFGHRTIDITKELRRKLYNEIKNLIVNECIDTFLFGSKSQFDDLSYQVLSELKTDYPHIKRIYVRSHFPYIDDMYKSYILKNYEDTYYPNKVLNSGKSAYVQRNREMIDKSKFCIIYYNEKYTPSTKTKSGTRLAYDYAIKKNKNIINIFENSTIYGRDNF